MWNLWWTCGHDVTDHVDRNIRDRVSEGISARPVLIDRPRVRSRLRRINNISGHREENNTSLKHWIKNGTIQETQQCSVNESDKPLTSDKEEDDDDAERTSNDGSY